MTVYRAESASRNRSGWVTFASNRTGGRSRLPNNSTRAAFPAVTTRLAPEYARCIPVAAGGGAALSSSISVAIARSILVVVCRGRLFVPQPRRPVTQELPEPSRPAPHERGHGEAGGHR